MMKKMLLVVVVLCMLCVCGYVDTHYTRKDCVVVGTEGQCVTVEDGQGHLWCYEVEGEAPACGTVVDVHMYNNNTHNNIYDDEVVAIH